MTKAFVRALLLLCLLATVGGCATVNGPPAPNDPWEGFNRSMYKFNDKLDRYILKPVAKGYQAITPQPVDNAVTNFFSNIDDVLVLMNDLLQLKGRQSLQDFSRLVWNSTVGFFGLFDVATSFGLPKHNEDFGQTLGYWGVGPGPYLVLPFFGPSDLRDAGGLAVDWTADPTYQQSPNTNAYYGIEALKYVDKRADLLKTTKLVNEVALDPYTFIREAYLQRRRNLVYDGNPPDNDLDLMEQELLGPDSK